MPLTDAYLATCRTAIEALAELTTFRSSLAPATQTRAGRIAAWVATFATNEPLTPAYNLRAAIRNVVKANAGVSVSVGEQESAYRTFVAEYAPSIPREPSTRDEAAALNTLFDEDALS